MSTEPKQDRILDHDYDGIQEYDNPMPRWWLWIFYATIVFAVLYAINLPGIGSGKGRIASYEREMAMAREKYGAAGAGGPRAALGDGAILALAHDPARVALGRTVFATNCVACHGPDGGGVIGPNLCDDFWIHGGRPAQVLATVASGVPDKGMPTWGPVLKPDQLEDVVAYVVTLRGTHPANPKEPQGVKEESATENGK